MVDIGKSVVALSQPVLDALKCEEIVANTTVLAVSILLPPGLVKDGKRAAVLLPDGIDKSSCVWKGVVVNLKHQKLKEVDPYT